MTEAPLIFYDRSRVVADWKCPRARYYGYEYDGRGITSDSTHLALFLGTTVHDGLAAVAHGVAIDDIAKQATNDIRDALLANTDGVVESEAEMFANEQAALAEGMLRGYHQHVWPGFTKRYPEIVAIEQEMLYKHDGLAFMSKPDLIVKDKEGVSWYVEYKTTSSVKEQWLNSWTTAVQLHSSVRAVEATIGEAPTGVVVQGLYKGYVSYGKQSSPFCYSYHKAGNPPFTKDFYAYDYAHGLKRYPVWQMPGGVRDWVARMPEEKLSEQFPQVPPIFINDHMVDTFFTQRAAREKQIASARGTKDPEVLNKVFPQNFESCNPAYGTPCPFRLLCFGNVEEPLERGFVYRKPHHQPEADAYESE